MAAGLGKHKSRNEPIRRSSNFNGGKPSCRAGAILASITCALAVTTALRSDSRDLHWHAEDYTMHIVNLKNTSTTLTSVDNMSRLEYRCASSTPIIACHCHMPVRESIKVLWEGLNRYNNFLSRRWSSLMDPRRHRPGNINISTAGFAMWYSICGGSAC